MNALEQQRLRELFDRWRRALARVDEIERIRTEARAELEGAEGELRALARKTR